MTKRNRFFKAKQTLPLPDSREGQALIALAKTLPQQLTKLTSTDVQGRRMAQNLLQVRNCTHDIDQLQKAQKNYRTQYRLIRRIVSSLESMLANEMEIWCKPPFPSRRRPLASFIDKINHAPEESFLRVIATNLNTLYHQLLFLKQDKLATVLAASNLNNTNQPRIR